MVPNHDKNGYYYMNAWLSQFTKGTSNLKKVEREVHRLKPKHQNRLVQGDCVYSAQSWKERISLCQSMFTLIERWTWIL